MIEYRVCVRSVHGKMLQKRSTTFNSSVMSAFRFSMVLYCKLHNSSKPAPMSWFGRLIDDRRVWSDLWKSQQLYLEILINLAVLVPLKHSLKREKRDWSDNQSQPTSVWWLLSEFSTRNPLLNGQMRVISISHRFIILLTTTDICRKMQFFQSKERNAANIEYAFVIDRSIFRKNILAERLSIHWCPISLYLFSPISTWLFSYCVYFCPVSFTCLHRLSTLLRYPYSSLWVIPIHHEQLDNHSATNKFSRYSQWWWQAFGSTDHQSPARRWYSQDDDPQWRSDLKRWERSFDWRRDRALLV